MTRAAFRPSLAAMMPIEKRRTQSEYPTRRPAAAGDRAEGDAGYDALPDWVKEHMRLNAGTHAARFRNNGGFAPFTPDGARSIRVPTLLMTGQPSPAALRVLSAELARYLPNAHTVEIPNASHAMHLANPDATVKAIEGFLGGN